LQEVPVESEQNQLLAETQRRAKEASEVTPATRGGQSCLKPLCIAADPVLLCRGPQQAMKDKFSVAKSFFTARSADLRSSVGSMMGKPPQRKSDVGVVAGGSHFEIGGA